MVLSFTVITAVSLGILAAFGAITGILNALAPQTRTAKAPAILVASQSHASGD